MAALVMELGNCDFPHALSERRQSSCPFDEGQIEANLVAFLDFFKAMKGKRAS